MNKETAPPIPCFEFLSPRKSFTCEKNSADRPFTMSVTFNNDAKFGEGNVSVVENGGEKQNYARRMSRRGSVLNTTAQPPPDGVLVNSDRAYSVVAENLPDFTDLHDEAREHTAKEVSLGFFGGLKTYPKAAAWSVLLSSSIIMEG